MRIVTWNVNGIRAREAQLLDYVAQYRPDVLCLQEIKAAPAQIPSSLSELEGYWCYWHGEKGYSGVGLHVRKELSPERPHFAHPAFDMENRIVTAQIGELTVASIYVPNGGKDFRAKLRFLEALKAYAAAFQSTNDALVLCGDLNIARAEIDVHPSERRNVIGQLPQERAWFDQLLGNDLIDIGRALHPDDDRMYTWWAPWRGMRQRNIGWRLDYVLATTSLADRVNACGAAREFGTSDHAPLLADFEL